MYILYKKMNRNGVWVKVGANVESHVSWPPGRGRCFRHNLPSLIPTTARFNIKSSSQSCLFQSHPTWGQCVQICRPHDSSPDGCLATAGQRSYRHRQNPPWLLLSLPLLTFFQCAAVCSLHCAVCVQCTGLLCAVCNAQVLLAFFQTCALHTPPQPSLLLLQAVKSWSSSFVEALFFWVDTPLISSTCGKTYPYSRLSFARDSALSKVGLMVKMGQDFKVIFQSVSMDSEATLTDTLPIWTLWQIYLLSECFFLYISIG